MTASAAAPASRTAAVAVRTFRMRMTSRVAHTLRTRSGDMRDDRGWALPGNLEHRDRPFGEAAQVDLAVVLAHPGGHRETLGLAAEVVHQPALAVHRPHPVVLL